MKGLMYGRPHGLRDLVMAEMKTRMAKKDADGKHAKLAEPPALKGQGQPLSQEAKDERRQLAMKGVPQISNEAIEERQELKAAGARSIARRDISGD